jgi:hypothetical protein
MCSTQVREVCGREGEGEGRRREDECRHGWVGVRVDGSVMANPKAQPHLVPTPSPPWPTKPPNPPPSGGYHEEHPVILLFWQVMASFSAPQQRALLKFVTSCSRAPLLGFRWVQRREGEGRVWE